ALKNGTGRWRPPARRAWPSELLFDDDRWLVTRRERGPSDPILALRLFRHRVARLDDLRRLLEGQRLRLAPKGRLEHLVHRVDEHKLHRLADLVGGVPQVLLVLERKDHGPRPREGRREDLALQPTDREDPTAERDLPGHCDVLPDRASSQGTHDGRGHREAGRGPVR